VPPAWALRVAARTAPQRPSVDWWGWRLDAGCGARVRVLGGAKGDRGGMGHAQSLFSIGATGRGTVPAADPLGILAGGGTEMRRDRWSRLVGVVGASLLGLALLGGMVTRGGRAPG
jgi:hypothetical protein